MMTVNQENRELFNIQKYCFTHHNQIYFKLSVNPTYDTKSNGTHVLLRYIVIISQKQTVPFRKSFKIKFEY